ncbi:hypothetical protein HGRIS_014525 [Hohenbuehelia grisea]|uniref:NmrA-like domain-containing protein n=1 Tax=Hohenbuehelia grisea TaxID=104357 RepID=A0ABR3JTQ0_9AGAR
MAILVTGGTGKTGRPIVRLLHQGGHSVYVASRSGKAPKFTKGVHFDWADTTTFEAPFIAAAAAKETITAVYLICPFLPDPSAIAQTVNAFVDLAISKGAQRFVLLSASAIEKGEAGLGQQGFVQEYLDTIGADYVSLRPTYFMDNFIDSFDFPNVMVKTHNTIYSAAQDARIPFVAAEDIAKAAVEALTAEKVVHKDLFVGGPELLTFDNMAATLTEVLGRPITHTKNTPEEQTAVLIKLGLPEGPARYLSAMDARFAMGEEERRFQAENKWMGTQTFKSFLQSHHERKV